jgi:hypothetical protein
LSLKLYMTLEAHGTDYIVNQYHGGNNYAIGACVCVCQGLPGYSQVTSSRYPLIYALPVRGRNM